MAGTKSFYDLLDLPTDATADEIRHAYREAALRYHPDVNHDQQAIDAFLQAQKAYEILSNTKAREDYDRGLSEEDGQPVRSEFLYSCSMLPRMDEPQMVYALLTFTPGKQFAGAPNSPVNICLVLDRSTSMQGVRMDTVKEAATELLRRLSPQDQLSIVTFSDRAEVLAPVGRRTDRNQLETQIQMIRAGGGTEMFQGLEAGFSEVVRFSSKSFINHLILITDGRTYGDEDACLRLAERSAAQGIRITGLGIGSDWNDIFLDKLTGMTGGSSIFVPRTGDMRQLLRDKLDDLKSTFADRVVLSVKPCPGVKLISAYRITPEPFLMTGKLSLRLGNIPQDDGLAVMLEMHVAPMTFDAARFYLATGELEYVLPSDAGHPHRIAFKLSRLTAEQATIELPPKPIYQALSQLNLYRMQERARYEVSVGKTQAAGTRLKRLATELLNRGEVELARTAIMEAERIQQTQMLSAEGEKQIKYGTRALALLPAPNETKAKNK